MDDLICDVAVIGAGSAGLAAFRAAKAGGAKTVLIEAGPGGTTCAATGCMPSKLLIAAGNAARAARPDPVFGIKSGSIEIDGPAVMKRVQRERDHFVLSARHDYDQLTPGERLHGRARFTGPNELDVDGRRVLPKAVVIATGAKSSIPDAFAPVRDRVLTNETVFDLPDLPKTLAVIGAGALGLELAQAFSRLGVKVTVFQRGSSIAGIASVELAQDALAVLGGEMLIRTNADVGAASPSGDGIAIDWATKDGGHGVETFSHVLVAAGRPPALAALDLAKAGLELNERGVPRFDTETMQCGDHPIFLAGDAAGDRAVLHEAVWEGKHAGRNAAKFPHVERRPRTPPLTMAFTDPAIVAVGARGSALPPDAVTGTTLYADHGRARIDAVRHGRICVYAGRDGRLLGSEIMGYCGDHFGHLLAAAIQDGKTVHQVLAMPFYHPTYEEILRAALRDAVAKLAA